MSENLVDAIMNQLEVDRELAVVVDIANARLSTDEHPAAFCAICGEPTGSDRPVIGIPERGRELAVVHAACAERK